MSAEHTAKQFGFTRQMQDEYALGSYRKTAEASLKNKFRREVCEVVIDVKGVKKLIDTDEEFMRNRFEDIAKCKPLYSGDGTITAGNASTLNDGAAACVLMAADRAKEIGVKPLAKVLGFSDAACHAIDYSMAPSLCIPKVLDRAGLSIHDVDYFEISEAFAVVPLVTIRKLGLNPDKVNPHGGAISIGHPIAASGTRQVVHLANSLKSGEIGVAVINNGGGGSTGIAIQKI
jgi:acetyl-CoA C-acetyltransferase